MRPVDVKIPQSQEVVRGSRSRRSREQFRAALLPRRAELPRRVHGDPYVMLGRTEMDTPDDPRSIRFFTAPSRRMILR
jgi:hypothetical protein